MEAKNLNIFAIINTANIIIEKKECAIDKPRLEVGKGGILLPRGKEYIIGIFWTYK